VWEVVTPFAQGRVAAFYEPARWIPHVTIKRCGSQPEAFGRAMARLANEDLVWRMTIDNVSVQHDPGQNSLTHYLRLAIPLGRGAAAQPVTAATLPTNATILSCEMMDEAGSFRLHPRDDQGEAFEQVVSAPEMVHLMADAAASHVHFPQARCQLANGRVVRVIANSPFPVPAR
jgi:hypothetical protein